MKLKKTALILGIVLASVTQISEAQKVCANTVSGEFNTRSKCKKNEIPVSSNNLMDLTKGKTTYLSSCRTIDSTDYTTNGTAGASVRCNGNEFLLNYGEYVDPIRLSVIRMNDMDYEANIPVGVFIISQIDFGVPSSITNNTYTLHVTGTCCPRI